MHLICLFPAAQATTRCPVPRPPQRDTLTALQRLQAAGASRLVLDLRDNRGGLVSEGIEVARLFLDDGALVVRTEGKARASAAPILAQGPAATTGAVRGGTGMAGRRPGMPRLVAPSPVCWRPWTTGSTMAPVAGRLAERGAWVPRPAVPPALGLPPQPCPLPPWRDRSARSSCPLSAVPCWITHLHPHPSPPVPGTSVPHRTQPRWSCS